MQNHINEQQDTPDMSHMKKWLKKLIRAEDDQDSKVLNRIIYESKQYQKQQQSQSKILNYLGGKGKNGSEISKKQQQQIIQIEENIFESQPLDEQTFNVTLIQQQSVERMEQRFGDVSLEPEFQVPPAQVLQNNYQTLRQLFTQQYIDQAPFQIIEQKPQSKNFNDDLVIRINKCMEEFYRERPDYCDIQQQDNFDQFLYENVLYHDDDDHDNSESGDSDDTDYEEQEENENNGSQTDDEQESSSDDNMMCIICTDTDPDEDLSSIEESDEDEDSEDSETDSGKIEFQVKTEKWTYNHTQPISVKPPNVEIIMVKKRKSTLFCQPWIYLDYLQQIIQNNLDETNIIQKFQQVFQIGQDQAQFLANFCVERESQSEFSIVSEQDFEIRRQQLKNDEEDYSFLKACFKRIRDKMQYQNSIRMIELEPELEETTGTVQSEPALPNRQT